MIQQGWLGISFNDEHMWIKSSSEGMIEGASGEIGSVDEVADRVSRGKSIQQSGIFRGYDIDQRGSLPGLLIDFVAHKCGVRIQCLPAVSFNGGINIVAGGISFDSPPRLVADMDHLFVGNLVGTAMQRVCGFPGRVIAARNSDHLIARQSVAVYLQGSGIVVAVHNGHKDPLVQDQGI